MKHSLFRAGAFGCAVAVLGGISVLSPTLAAPERATAAPHARHSATPAKTNSLALPPLPANLPGWLFSRKNDEIFYKRGAYNYDIYNVQPLAYDLNAVAVGHAMAYEDLVTGRADRLETDTFKRINTVLSHPPKLMPDEKFLSPTFGRKYGVLEQVFDWTHILHAQTVDVLASTKLTPAQKDREIEALWRYYFDNVPYAITPLPMNMEYLDSQPYSKAFRTKYPKTNGLFWGYHWLQGSMYDVLWHTTLGQQKRQYEVLGNRYHDTELYRVDRPFMPMFGEESPRFAAKFPHIANAFDNLHMLHDMVNDILASDLTERQKDEQITRAIWLVSAAAHKGEKPGEQGAKVSAVSTGDTRQNGMDLTGMHDHRFMSGMEGMGMMKGSTPELMYMPKMGWMNMSLCHHCSMPLTDNGIGDGAWQNSTVSAEGWTMRVRCALCARDMSSETKGAAILHLATEDPYTTVVVISDEAGNLTTDTPDVVFLEEVANHARCSQWSQAFTNRAAFDAYVQNHPRFKDAKPLTFAQWSNRESAGTPSTYTPEHGPVENPYAHDETHPEKNTP